MSPENVNKAYHSPYFQNGSQKSALEFLRFPFLVAFSHKELIGLFWPDHGLYCQNDEVSPNVHTPVHDAKGSPIPPLVTADKLLLVTSSSWAQRGILNALVLTRFAPDYD